MESEFGGPFARVGVCGKSVIEVGLFDPAHSVSNPIRVYRGSTPANLLRQIAESELYRRMRPKCAENLEGELLGAYTSCVQGVNKYLQDPDHLDWKNTG